MASRADERMALDTTDSDGVVGDHVGQDQLGVTGPTTHHSHPRALRFSVVTLPAGPEKTNAALVPGGDTELIKE
jgi:hypothetical protein